MRRARRGGKDETPLRAMTSNFVAAWLSAVTDVVEGSSEGNPQANGQSVADEHMEYGDWSDRYNRPIPLKMKTHTDLGNWDSKLFGSPQLERLLRFFMFIVNESPDTKISEQLVEDATATGFKSLMAGSNTFSQDQAASLISLVVAKALQDTYAPLVAYLCSTASETLKRVAPISFGVLDSRRGDRSRTGETNLQDMRGYSYFASTLREIFETYAERIGELCLKQCTDELKCSQFVSLRSWSDVLKGSQSFSMKDVRTCAQEVFGEVSETITQNLVLAAHHYFLVFFPRDVSAEVLQEVASLDSAELEAMFEMEQVREQLEADEKNLKNDLEKMIAHETDLRGLAGAFSRFKTV